MDKKVVKVYGMPRTCTNVLEVHLAHNYDVIVLVHTPEWKHWYRQHDGRYSGELDPESVQLNGIKELTTDKINYILCTKHPYQWLVSFFHAFKENESRSFSEFIRGYSYHYKDVMSIEENPIVLFNKLNSHWLHVDNNLPIVQQEMWTNLAIPIMKDIQNRFGLKKSGQMAVDVTHMAAGLMRYNKPYHPQQINIEDDDLKYINDTIDETIVSKLGYKLTTI